MAKIPFNIKYRPQIESGEYKVCSRTDEPVRIIEWNRKGNFPIVAIMGEDENRVLFFTDWGTQSGNLTTGDDLFVITPVPELTEFEQKLKEIVDSYNGGTITDEGVVYYANNLLFIAKKELCKNCKRIAGRIEGIIEGTRGICNSLPKWKKVETNAFYPDITYSGKGKCPMLHYGKYEINIVKLKEALPKEEE